MSNPLPPLFERLIENFPEILQFSALYHLNMSNKTVFEFDSKQQLCTDNFTTLNKVTKFTKPQ